MKTLLPMNDNILCKRREEKKMSNSGLLHIPDTANMLNVEAEVISCGPGRMLDNGVLYPPTVKPGNTVIIPRGGMELKFDGQEFVMIQEYQILAIVLES